MGKLDSMDYWLDLMKYSRMLNLDVAIVVLNLFC